MNAVVKEKTYRDSQHELMALYMGGGNSDLYAAARKLEEDRAYMLAALERIANVVSHKDAANEMTSIARVTLGLVRA